MRWGNVKHLEKVWHILHWAIVHSSFLKKYRDFSLIVVLQHAPYMLNFSHYGGKSECRIAHNPCCVLQQNYGKMEKLLYRIFVTYRWLYNILKGIRGNAVFEVMCYKSEGRWFDSRWCLWRFFIDTKSFRSHYGPGIVLVCNRNEYQEHFLGVKAAGA